MPPAFCRRWSWPGRPTSMGSHVDRILRDRRKPLTGASRGFQGAGRQYRPLPRKNSRRNRRIAMFARHERSRTCHALFSFSSFSLIALGMNLK